jgi:hypothetical protein
MTDDRDRLEQLEIKVSHLEHKFNKTRREFRIVRTVVYHIMQMLMTGIEIVGITELIKEYKEKRDKTKTEH